MGEGFFWCDFPRVARSSQPRAGMIPSFQDFGGGDGQHARWCGAPGSAGLGKVVGSIRLPQSEQSRIPVEAEILQRHHFDEPFRIANDGALVGHIGLHKWYSHGCRKRVLGAIAYHPGTYNGCFVEGFPFPGPRWLVGPPPNQPPRYPTLNWSSGQVLS